MSEASPISATEGVPPNDIRLPDGSYLAVHNVDVIYTNMNVASNFRIVRTGTDGPVEEALLQVAKHLSRGLYQVVSLNASKHAMHVIIWTELSREDLMFKNGFPWDREDD